jgi:hypothetical protein
MSPPTTSLEALVVAWNYVFYTILEVDGAPAIVNGGEWMEMDPLNYSYSNAAGHSTTGTISGSVAYSLESIEETMGITGDITKIRVRMIPDMDVFAYNSFYSGTISGTGAWANMSFSSLTLESTGASSPVFYSWPIPTEFMNISASAPAAGVVSVPENSAKKIKVKLKERPLSDTNVSMSSTGDTDLAVSPMSLVFTPTNWEVAQEVTINARPDADNSNGTSTLTLSSSSAGQTTVTLREADSTVDLLTLSAILNPSNAGMVLGTGSGILPGTVRQISAVPNPGWLFSHWQPVSAGISVLNTTSQVTTATVNGSGVIMAYFVPDPGGGAPPSLEVSQTSLAVPETSTATFTIRLTSRPSSDTAVGLAPNAGGDTDLTLSPSTLSFSTADWGTPKTVTVSAADDNDKMNGSRSFSISASGMSAVTLAATEVDNDATLTLESANTSQGTVSGGGLVTKGVASQIVASPLPGFAFVSWSVSAGEASLANSATPSTTATIQADATVRANFQALPSIVLSSPDISVMEGSTTPFMISLSSPPLGTATVSVGKSSGDTDLNAQSSTVTFTPSDWSSPKPVSIAASQDPDTTNGSAVFSFASPGLATVSATAREIDDDNLVSLTVVSEETRTNLYAGHRGGAFGSGRYPPGSVVEIEAIPMTRFGASTGYTFAEWVVTSGSAVIQNPLAQKTSVTLNGNATVAARFTGGGEIKYLDLSPLHYGNGQQLPSGEGLYVNDVEIRDMFMDSQNCGTCLQPGYPSGGLVVTVRGRLQPTADDGNNWLNGGVGGIYGYSDDLGMAVVHAGLARDGELVTILVTANGFGYAGSGICQNGICSQTHSSRFNAAIPTIKITRYTGTEFPPPTLPNTRIVASSDPSVEISPTTITVPEGRTAPLYVRLSSPPPSNVMVTIFQTSATHYSSGAEYHISPYLSPNFSQAYGSRGAYQSLMFTPQNWSTPQVVTLTAGSDSDDVNGSMTFALSAPGLPHVQITATEADRDSKLTLTSSDVNQGTVAVSGSTSGATSSRIITTNTSTTIYAYPKTGFKFSNWEVVSGSPTMTNTTNPTNSVRIFSPTSLRALFSPQ